MKRQSREENGSVRWLFGDLELAPERGLLLRDGEPLALARKPFQMLVHLVRERHRVVTVAELLEVVWPGVRVSDDAFASVVRDLRRALGDDAARPRYVATLRGRGLRLVATVRAVPDAPAPEARDASSWELVSADLERALRALDRLHASRGGPEPEPPLTRERGALLVARARARWASGATARARQSFREIADLGRRAGDGEILAQAALGYAGRTDASPTPRTDAVALLEEALSRQAGAGDPALRSELTARLATELYGDPDVPRSQRLARDGLALAERSGDDAALAYALTALHFTHLRPDVAPERRRVWTERALALVADAPPSDVRALALQQRMLDLLEEGAGGAFQETFRAYGETVDALDLPFFHFLRALLEGTRALLDGRLDEAEELAHAAHERGRSVESPNAPAALAAQLFAVRTRQGRLAELLPLLRAARERPDAPPAFVGALAAATAAAGDPAQTRRVLATALPALAALPRDHSWLGSAVATARAAAREGDPAALRVLRATLAPHAGRVAVAGHGAALVGTVDRALAQLARRAGDTEAAARHEAGARALHARLGADVDPPAVS